MTGGEEDMVVTGKRKRSTNVIVVSAKEELNNEKCSNVHAQLAALYSIK
jgi:hypothetical protein